MPKLTINLVVQNGERYIPFLMSSLKAQSFKDWEMIIVDNASTDRTVELLEAELKNSGFSYRLIRNSANLGFSVGHNQAFAEIKTPYFLLQNVDMYLLPNVLEKIVAFIDTHPDAAAVAPRLMRRGTPRPGNQVQDPRPGAPTRACQRRKQLMPAHAPFE